MPISNTAHAAIGSITQYTAPTADAFLDDITLGPDNNIWYTGYGPTINTRIGKVTTSGSFTEYPNLTVGSKYPKAISKGSDGNIWYSEGNSSSNTRIVNVTTSGIVLGQYPIPSGRTALRMTLGPDGAVWFTLSGSAMVGKITTSGSITEYSIPGTSDITDITTGPDGNLWFTVGATGSYNNKIGKITTSGVATTYPIATYGAYPQGITVGSDGNLWFTEAVNKIGKITSSGTITEYLAPTSGGAQGITAGSDGALWFTKESSGKIGRVTTSGTFTEYTVPGATSTGIAHIITGPDGAVWFLDWVHDKIGRVATELTNQTTSFTSTMPTHATIGGSTYTPTATATSGLPVVITIDPSSSSVCSIDGSGVVSFQGTGTCILNANQTGNADYNPATQVQQSFTVFPINADTAVALSCPATATVGSTVTCTITISNNGPAAAETVSLTALFSDSLSSASISGGGTLSGQYINWSTPSLASGDSATLTFSATASVPGKARFNAALLQTSPDPDISNNIVDTIVTIN